MVPPTVTETVNRYLAQVDQLLPGVITGCYLVGSVALGAYRENRSDIDFVAVSDRGLSGAELRRLRLHHARSGLHTTAVAIRQRRSPLTGTCNGVFIRAEDLSRPVTQITPVASHVAQNFSIGHAGSDVSPVAWKVLAERGLPIRGPAPASLSLDPQAELLRSWSLENLASYWRPWASMVTERSPFVWFGLRPRWSTAWGVLGAPRLHHTIATGEVISKEAAGEYSLDVFPRWHPLIEEALAYWRGVPYRHGFSRAQRARLTSEFVLEVAAAAQELPTPG